jgi:hypothetical protein
VLQMELQILVVVAVVDPVMIQKKVEVVVKV